MDEIVARNNICTFDVVQCACKWQMEKCVRVYVYMRVRELES